MVYTANYKDDWPYMLEKWILTGMQAGVGLSQTYRCHCAITTGGEESDKGCVPLWIPSVSQRQLSDWTLQSLEISDDHLDEGPYKQDLLHYLGIPVVSGRSGSDNRWLWKEIRAGKGSWRVGSGQGHRLQQGNYPVNKIEIWALHDSISWPSLCTATPPAEAILIQAKAWLHLQCIDLCQCFQESSTLFTANL